MNGHTATGYSWSLKSKKMSPLASKMLVLELNDILDPELENRQKISIWKMGQLGLQRAVKIKPGYKER